MALSGHFWTLFGYLSRAARPPVPPVSRAWTTVVQDPRVGAVRLTGELSDAGDADGVVIVVHGLGGCAASPYVVESAARAVESGLACLRLNLRGADRKGEDVYHAGLTADLQAAIASPEIGAYDRILVLGFSMGGHLALRLAVESAPAAIAAVAAVCAPLDLAATASSMDRACMWPYRRYLLGQLREMYAAVARRRPGPPLDRVRLARTFVQFDSLVIAPRHGFRDAWDYYRRASVGPRLRGLRTPTLLVAAAADPFVPMASLRPFLDSAPATLALCRVRRGGHLGFPADLNLGFGKRAGLAAQLVCWLRGRL